MKLDLRDNRGFTLIELLIVLVIIGILATIVVAVLNGAKTDANDTSIKSEFSSLKTQTELIHSINANFDAVCGSNSETQDGNIVQLINKINSTNGSGSVTCNSDTDAWAFAAGLPGGGAFCVDNTSSVHNDNASDELYTGDTSGTDPALDDSNDLQCN